jgi:hypothetical protein
MERVMHHPTYARNPLEAIKEHLAAVLKSDPSPA